MSGQGLPGGPSRPFKLYSPAVDFIENRMSHYHKAFDTSGFHYNPSQGQFVALAPTSITQASSSLAVPNVPAPLQPRPAPGSINAMGFWGEVFPKAMKRLNEEPEPQDNQREWGIRNLSAWRDVQARLEMAQREYDFHHGARNVGRFRRKLRRVLDKATGPLQKGMKFVPDADIASPVISVVNMLLDAYRQASEVRETIKSQFDDLPVSFVTMDFYFRNYPEDQNIVKTSIKLVFLTFKAIEEAVEFYTSPQAKRAGLAVITGEQYQKKLLQSLTEIKLCSDALENEAKKSFTHRVVSDGDQTRRSHALLIQGNFETRQAIETTHREERLGQAWLGYLINRSVMDMSVLTVPPENWPPQSPIPSRSITPGQVDLLPWSPRDLWSRLQIPNIDETDLQNVLNRAAEIIFEDRGRAEQVLETSFFRDWIFTPGSAKLLVHGDFSATNKISPLSILCATITQAFRMSPGTASLVFFCGCHVMWDDYQGGGLMIRTLIAQLLRHFPSLAINPNPMISMHDIEIGSIAQLCKLFIHLIHQLPSRTTVYCLIDGINEYESENYLHDMDEVVMSLLELVDGSNQAMRAKFKLLLTSPQPTVEVRQVFDQEPGDLLHMSQLPRTEEGVGLIRIQEQLGAGVESRRQVEEEII